MRDIGLATVGYFYVDGRDSAKQEPCGLLSSPTTQLCTHSGHLCNVLSSLYTTCVRGAEQPSEDALVQCLKEMLEDPKQEPVFIVVDALDEFPHSRGLPTLRENALDIVKALVGLNLPHLHFCVTSRHEIDIQRVLDPLGPYGISLHEEQIDDVAEYVKAVILSDSTMRLWPPETKQLVISTLERDCGGMWVLLSRCFILLQLLMRCLQV